MSLSKIRNDITSMAESLPNIQDKMSFLQEINNTIQRLAAISQERHQIPFAEIVEEEPDAISS